MHLMMREIQACDLGTADWSHQQPAAIWQMGSLLLFALLCGGLCYLSPRTTGNCSLGQGNDVSSLMVATVIWLFDITITRKLPRLHVSSCLGLICDISLRVFCNDSQRIHNTTDSQRMQMHICNRSN